MSTAVETAAAVKDWLHNTFGDGSDSSRAYYDENVAVLTQLEAKARVGDIVPIGDTMALLIVHEGQYDWPTEAWAALHADFPDWVMESPTGFAMGLYPSVARIRKVVFDVPVQCYVTVTTSADNTTVSKITFMPKESDAGYFGPKTNVFAVLNEMGDTIESDEDAVDRARELIDGSAWEPLSKLPDAITWEN